MNSSMTSNALITNNSSINPKAVLLKRVENAQKVLMQKRIIAENAISRYHEENDGFVNINDPRFSEYEKIAIDLDKKIADIEMDLVFAKDEAYLEEVDAAKKAEEEKKYLEEEKKHLEEEAKATAEAKAKAEAKNQVEVEKFAKTAFTQHETKKKASIEKKRLEDEAAAAKEKAEMDNKAILKIAKDYSAFMIKVDNKYEQGVADAEKEIDQYLIDEQKQNLADIIKSANDTYLSRIEEFRLVLKQENEEFQNSRL